MNSFKIATVARGHPARRRRSQPLLWWRSQSGLISTEQPAHVLVLASGLRSGAPPSPEKSPACPPPASMTEASGETGSPREGRGRCLGVDGSSWACWRPTPPALYSAGCPLCPPYVTCFRTSACFRMTISPMRKVRFGISKSLAPSHLASTCQSCSVPTDLADTSPAAPALSSTAAPEEESAAEMRLGCSSLLAPSSPATDAPCTHSGGSLSQLLSGWEV